MKANGLHSFFDQNPTKAITTKPQFQSFL